MLFSIIDAVRYRGVVKNRKERGHVSLHRRSPEAADFLDYPMTFNRQILYAREVSMAFIKSRSVCSGRSWIGVSRESPTSYLMPAIHHPPLAGAAGTDLGQLETVPSSE